VFTSLVTAITGHHSPSPKARADPSHTIKTFLENGYPVRGTVRSQAKGEYLADLFKDAKAPFEFVIVEDIAKVPLDVVALTAAGSVRRGRQGCRGRRAHRQVSSLPCSQLTPARSTSRSTTRSS
jgi:hypothetical protein